MKDRVYFKNDGAFERWFIKMNGNGLSGKGAWSAYVYYKEINGFCYARREMLKAIPEEHFGKWIQFHKDKASEYDFDSFKYVKKMSYSSDYVALLK